MCDIGANCSNEPQHVRFVCTLCAGVHVACGYSLTASVAFPALALFNLLRFPIIMFPSQVRISILVDPVFASDPFYPAL